MSVFSSAIQTFFPVQSAPINIIRKQWDTASKLPGGKLLFSKLIGRAAPYSGTVGARVEEIHMGYARVSIEDKPQVRNHLECVHAVALVNLAEMTGNLGLGYSMPDDARFIVAGLSIEYLKKARGKITAISESPIITSAEKKEYAVPVVMTNEQGEIVAKATLQTLVGPKKR